MFSYKKIPYFNLLPIVILSFIFLKFINNLDIVTATFGKFLSVISYFIWAFVISYLLNPLMVYLEKKMKIRRLFSILIIYSLFLGFLALIIILVVPRMTKSILELLNSMPTFINETQSFISTAIEKNNIFSKYGLDVYLAQNADSIIKTANNFLKIAFDTAFSQLLNFTAILFKLLSAIVISIYLLKDKEIFINNIKKFIYILFTETHSNIVLSFGRRVNIVFQQYVIGKSIDSLLIGLLCFLGLTFLKIPYPLLISLIIGFTNMIPYFGNAIGMIPACILTLFSSPLKAFQLAILILVLQQFDGWFLSPKILGEKIGLSPLWIILAITIGGGMFGIIGMFLGVPVVAILKLSLEDYMNSKEAQKNNLQ